MKIAKTQVTMPQSAGIFSFTFALEEWTNQSIAALPYFDRLRGFADAIVQKKLIHQEITLDGNRVTVGTLGYPNDPEPFEFAAAVIANLAKARAVVTKLGVTVVLPNLDDLTIDDYQAVELAHSILLGSSTPRKGVGTTVAITLNRGRHAPSEVIAGLEAHCSQQGMTVTTKSQRVMVYGTPVSLGDVTYSVNPVKLVVPEPGRSEFLAGRSDSASAMLESLPDSEVTITVARASTGTPHELALR